jgi:hypothetical protein
MPLKVARFIALMLAALTLGLSVAHLMQLPARMGWDQYLWVGSTVQGGLNAAFGTAGAILSVATVIALAPVAYFVREHNRPGFRLVLAAAILFGVAFVLLWVVIYPVNVELAKWVDGPVPADWTSYRARWEWGYAAISLIKVAGFGALAASVLADTPRGFR